MKFDRFCRLKRFPARLASAIAVQIIIFCSISVGASLSWANPALRIFASGRPEETSAVVNRTRAILAKLEHDFGLTIDAPITIKIAASYEEFRQIQPPNVRLPDWASGAAFPELNLILINRAASNQDASSFPKTLAHELSHLALERLFRHTELPRWLSEGLAMHLSDDWDIGRQIAMARAVVTERLIPLGKLMESFPENRIDAETAYSQSYYFLSFLQDRSGRKSLGQLIRYLGLGINPEYAFKQTTGAGIRSLESKFHQWLSRRFSVFWIVFGPLGWWSLCIGLLILAYLFRRRVTRRKLIKWEAEDHDDEDDGPSNDSLLFGGPGSSDGPPGKV